MQTADPSYASAGRSDVILGPSDSVPRFHDAIAGSLYAGSGFNDAVGPAHAVYGTVCSF